MDTSGAQRAKRPRRAASGGVMGAVAAEAATWGVADAPSPPLKRANSLPLGLDGQRGGAAGRRPVAERMSLLRKALAGDCGANAQVGAVAPAGGKGVGVEEEDAVSALFELSSSMC
jgi:hypothetical protein